MYERKATSEVCCMNKIRPAKAVIKFYNRRTPNLIYKKFGVTEDILQLLQYLPFFKTILFTHFCALTIKENNAFP